MKRNNILTVILLVLSSLLYSQNLSQKHDSALFCSHLADKVIKLQNPDDSVYFYYVYDTLVYSEKWDTLPHVQFWQQILNLPPDTSLINIASTRVILGKIASRDFEKLSTDKRKEYKDSIKRAYQLDSSVKILITSGKNHFYDFSTALHNITGSVPIFIENGVDPWYAQSILLIESPNKLQKSTAGAYGPFQLMRAVAKKYGLKVSKYQDERKYLDKSAYAASQLLKKACIPYIRRMLDTLRIPYHESDLFFRLLVLHAYHAGAGNVMAAFRAMNPSESGLPLFLKLWNTEAEKFKNASQNYSQVALAAHLNFNKQIQKLFSLQITEKKSSFEP